jgi:L-fucose isomerase-like protein
LILTGGTEGQALDLLSSVAARFKENVVPRPKRDPVLLLAHPYQNALPASLEILAALKQQGRAARIIFLDDTASGYQQLQQLLLILHAQRRLATLRLGAVGKSSEWLVAGQVSAQEVRERWAVELVEVAMSELLEGLKHVPVAKAEAYAQDFLQRAQGCVEPNGEDLAMAARVVTALQALVARHRLDAVTVRCFDLVMNLKTSGCLALSQLTDEGVIAGCEGDVPATLTMLWMNALSGEVPFMANPQEIIPSENSLWISHCTIARRLLKHYRLRSHFESGLGVAIEGHLHPGPITLARIGGEGLRALYVSNGELIANGDSAQRCRTQLKLKLQEDVSTFLQEPLGNHHVLIRGHWAQPLREYHHYYIRS